MRGVEEVHLLNPTVAPEFQRQGWAKVLLDALSRGRVARAPPGCGWKCAPATRVPCGCTRQPVFSAWACARPTTPQPKASAKTPGQRACACSCRPVAMPLALDTRQRAMLLEMGVHVWLPGTDAAAVAVGDGAAGRGQRGQRSQRGQCTLAASTNPSTRAGTRGAHCDPLATPVRPDACRCEHAWVCGGVRGQGTIGRTCRICCNCCTSGRLQPARLAGGGTAVWAGSSTVQGSTTQHRAIQRRALQHSTGQYNSVQGSTTQCRAVQLSAGQYNSVQGSTTQCRAVQHSAGQYNTVQGSTTQCRAPQDSTLVVSSKALQAADTLCLHEQRKVLDDADCDRSCLCASPNVI